MSLLIETLAGISLVIASACVFNNYIDRDIDKRMARTRKRAIASGRISGPRAIFYAVVLGLAGFLILAFFVNWIVFSLGFIALFFYVILYGVSKRRSVYGTLIGSIPGAVPPAAGYLAVTNHVDSAAVLLFLIMACWQMPHFYAIAMYRYKDYKSAGLPVLPVKRGMAAAKKQIIIYILAFTSAAAMLTIFGYTGFIYLAVVLLLGGYWLYIGFSGYLSENNQAWGRKMFTTSLLVTLCMSAIIAVGARLP